MPSRRRLFAFWGLDPGAPNFAEFYARGGGGRFPNERKDRVPPGPLPASPKGDRRGRTSPGRSGEAAKATVLLGLRHGEVAQQRSPKGDRFTRTSPRRSGKVRKTFLRRPRRGAKKSFRAYIGSAFGARQEPTKIAPENLCSSPACFFGGKERNCQCAEEKAPRRGKPPAPNDRPRPRPASPPGLVTKRRQRRPTFVAQTTPTVNLTFRPRGAKLNTRRGKPPRAPKRP